MYFEVKYSNVLPITWLYFEGFRMMVTPRTAAMATSKEALSVYLDPEIKELLATRAKEEDRSMAYLAAQAIKKDLLKWQASKAD
jgi:hypothetical protein